MIITPTQGPYEKRKSSRQFAEWVKLAGGRVRGSVRDKKKPTGDPASPPTNDPSPGQPRAQIPPRPVPQTPPQSQQPQPPPRALPKPAASQGTLRRTDSGTMQQNEPLQRAPSNPSPAQLATQPIEIWPLRLIDFDDEEQFKVIYALLRR